MTLPKKEREALTHVKEGKIAGKIRGKSSKPESYVYLIRNSPHQGPYEFLYKNELIQVGPPIGRSRNLMTVTSKGEKELHND